MSTKTFTLAISVALWKRPEVSAVILAHYASVEIPGADLKLYAVGSEAADKKLAEKHGWHYAEAPNDHLGRKRQAGLDAIRNDKPGALLRIGSDDLLSAGLLQKLVSQIKAGADCAWVKGHHMLDKPSGELVCFPHLEFMACISSSVLDQMDWKIYNTGEGTADNNLSARVRANSRRVATAQATADLPYLAIKTGDEINSIDRYKATGNYQVVSLDLITKHFPSAAGYLTGKKAVTVKKPATLAEQKES